MTRYHDVYLEAVLPILKVIPSLCVSLYHYGLQHNLFTNQIQFFTVKAISANEAVGVSDGRELHLRGVVALVQQLVDALKRRLDLSTNNIPRRNIHVFLWLD